MTTTVEETVRIQKSADTVWHEVRAFDAIGAWHPMLEEVTADGASVGSVRSASAVDGGEQVERLQTLDDDARVQRYTMEATPLPVDDYIGEIRVEAHDDGSSTVRWGAEFEVTSGSVEEVEEMIEGFLRSGLDALRQRFVDRAPLD